MTIELASLEKATAQLAEALAYANSELARTDPRLALHLRAATIQAFEFTYELSHKMLRRYLDSIDPNPAASEEMDFADLIRAGFEKGLLHEEISIWREFRRDRGTTSHAYDDTKAQAVFRNVPRFLTEAQFLLRELHARQGSAP